MSVDATTQPRRLPIIAILVRAGHLARERDQCQCGDENRLGLFTRTAIDVSHHNPHVTFTEAAQGRVYYVIVGGATVVSTTPP